MVLCVCLRRLILCWWSRNSDGEVIIKLFRSEMEGKSEGVGFVKMLSDCVVDGDGYRQPRRAVVVFIHFSSSTGCAK